LVREHQQYIGGEWVSSDHLFDDLDPYRGTVMATGSSRGPDH
jgi:hypothetical protein